MSQLLQIVGAVAVLVAFIAVQRGVLEPLSRTALALNLLGAGLLAWLAFVGHQWGFLLLEGSWAAVSLAGLRQQLRSQY